MSSVTLAMLKCYYSGPKMPPESDGSLRTVGCSLERLIPDDGHLRKIRSAVATVHKATILATELLNMHVRRMLASASRGVSW